MKKSAQVESLNMLSGNEVIEDQLQNETIVPAIVNSEIQLLSFDNRSLGMKLSKEEKQKMINSDVDDIKSNEVVMMQPYLQDAVGSAVISSTSLGSNFHQTLASPIMHQPPIKLESHHVKRRNLTKQKTQ